MHIFTEIDQQLLFLFNGSNSLFLDNIIVTLTSGVVWIPMYIALFYIIMKENETMAQINLIVACAIAAVVVTACITNFIVKPVIARPRPLNDPLIKYMVDMVIPIGNKDYSFFSAHAANTSVVATYLSFIFKRKLFTIAMSTWVVLNCYTRLYLGMHYPSDILCGLIFGIGMGYCFYRLFLRLQIHYFHTTIAEETGGTADFSYKISGNDIDIIITVMVLILAFAILKASFI